MDTKGKQPKDRKELRQRAEEFCQSGKANALAAPKNVILEASGPLPQEPLGAEAMHRALHELRVHQIELEMQNEELRRAQTELDAERERYFELYDLAPVGYCTLSEKGLILQANLTAASLLGLPRGALLRQPFSRFILHDDQDIYYQHRRRLFESGQPQISELRLVKPEGVVFWVRLEAVVSAQGDEPPVCRVVLSDITAVKQTERRLRESELHFRTLANSGQALIWTSGLDMLCDYFNEPWLAFTGRTLEQELGNGWTEGVHPDDFAHCLDVYVTAFNRRESFRMEYRLRHASGQYLWIVDRGMPRHDSQGNFLGYIGHCLDVSERKLAEEQVQESCVNLEEAVGHARRLAVQAEAASRAKSEFLANMSHEIRTPLNGLMGMLQLMQLSELSAEQHGYAEMAIRSGTRLTRLLSDILDLSRIEAGRMPLNLRPFSLSDSFNALTESFGPLCLEKHLPLRIAIAAAVPRHVVGDEVRIRQILFNLVGNAMKFTETGEILVEVWPLLPKPPEGLRLLFIIHDTGVGIPDEKIATVCEPFVQVAESYTRQQQGAGLGLSISRHLLEAMGGTLTIESAEGVGTSMYMMLPLGQATGPEAQEQPLPIPTSCTAAPLRILLVEDDEISQLSEKAMLQKLGHTVHTADDGGKALDALRSNVFDCVLMDVQMNVMDGLEATRRIRADVSGAFDAKIPIVAMTAYAMIGDRERFFEAGMDEHLPKPFGMDDLASVLGKVARC